MFVSNEAIPLTLDNENFVWIKPKLNYGQKMRVQNAAVKFTPKAGSEEMDTTVDTAAYQIALLVESIVRWNGPLLDGIPCDVEHISEMDPTDDLVDFVVTEISKRNKKKGISPKASAPDGVTLSKVTEKLELASGMSM